MVFPNARLDNTKVMAYIIRMRYMHGNIKWVSISFSEFRDQKIVFLCGPLRQEEEGGGGWGWNVNVQNPISSPETFCQRPLSLCFKIKPNTSNNAENKPLCSWLFFCNHFLKIIFKGFWASNQFRYLKIFFDKYTNSWPSFMITIYVVLKLHKT